MLAQAPLSAHSGLHAAIESRLRQAVAIARDAVGTDLRSIVLGGSVARGQAFGVDDGGALRLLSDLDLYCVADRVDRAGDLRRAVQEWTEADPFFVSPADVALVEPSWFGHADRAMPIHQLAHAHRVLWGEPIRIEPARSRDGSPEVDASNAAELLLNRCVEALDPRLGEPGGLLDLVHLTKRFIDAPMAWLGARGWYTPDRRAQIRQWAELLEGEEALRTEQMSLAMDHWAACLDARDLGVVNRERLQSLAAASDWPEWTGGFALSLLEDAGPQSVGDALKNGLDHQRLRQACYTWLHREPWSSRLRRARRWCSVAPAEVGPWWRHGMGGTGPDRIFAAAVLCFHGVEGWDGPVRELTRPAVDTPAALHALWWHWIQGRDDEV